MEDSITDNLEPAYASEEVREYWRKVAERTLDQEKSKRINIRIKRGDLALVKARAEGANMPYQTLLSTLIHKFAKGDIKLEV